MGWKWGKRLICSAIVRIILWLGKLEGRSGGLGWFPSSLTKTILANAPGKAWPGQPQDGGSSREGKGSGHVWSLATSLPTGPLACGWSSLPCSEPPAALRSRNAELFYPLLGKECLQLIRHLAGRLLMQLRANMLFPSVQTHLLSFFSFWLCCEACGILVPQSGIEPMPLQWKHRVLTTGLLGNSLLSVFLIALLQNWTW